MVLCNIFRYPEYLEVCHYMDTFTNINTSNMNKIFPFNDRLSYYKKMAFDWTPRVLILFIDALYLHINTILSYWIKIKCNILLLGLLHFFITQQHIAAMIYMNILESWFNSD